MTPKPEAVLVTILLGVLLAGPLAALALVAVPADWQGPAIPVAAGLLALCAVAIARHAGGRKPQAPTKPGDGAGPV